MPPRALLLPVLLALAACGGGASIDAPAPAGLGELAGDSALTLLPSVVDVPVEYDLGPAMAWLEETIPRRIGDLDERITVPGNSRIRFAFSAERERFRLRLEGTSATLTSVVSYRGRGWYNPPILPPVSGSCGINEAPPRVRVTVRTLVTPTPDWKLQARSRVAELRPLTEEKRDECTVTAVNINVTDRVLGAVRGLLNARLREVDRRLARFDLRGAVEDVWAFLAEPLQLRDSLWLVIDPAAIRLDQVSSEAHVLRTAVGITAYPRVVSGAAPRIAARALPPLDRSEAPAGLTLLSEGRIGWDVLTSILQRELRGNTIDVAGRRLEIVDIAVSGLDDGRAAVRLQVRGAARGTVYVVGTPTFVPAEEVLIMPDLEFDISTRSLMVAGLAWLAGGQVEEHLRSHLKLSVAGILSDGRDLLARELSRELAPGVRLRTEVERGDVVRLRARPTGLMVDALVTGRSTLELTLAPGRSVRDST